MSTNRRETVTIENIRGECDRVTLPLPHYDNPKSGRSEDTTGVWYTALYVGPRTGRMFLRSESIWDDGHGRCVGTRYRELRRDEYLDYCRRIGVEPIGPAAQPEEV